MNKAIWHGTGNQVKLISPFSNVDKIEIAKIGAKLQVPWESTYTCYEGDALHCGLCGSCNERLEAFKVSGIKDGVSYKQVTKSPLSQTATAS